MRISIKQIDELLNNLDKMARDVADKKFFGLPLGADGYPHKNHRNALREVVMLWLSGIKGIKSAEILEGEQQVHASPAEYGRQLTRLAQTQGLTIEKIAELLEKSPEQLYDCVEAALKEELEKLPKGNPCGEILLP